MKRKRLENNLKNWQEVNDCDTPSNIMVAQAVREHNASMFRVTPSDNGGYTYRPQSSIDNRPIIVTGPAKNDTWTCEVKDVEGCPIAEKPQVEVPWELYQDWVRLAQEFDTEWIAYLTGELNPESGRARIVEMYFPPQTASGAHVALPDDSFRVRPNTIAAIHSHVKMSAFFSKTDEDHANWPVEIVINAKGEYCMRMRVKLGCGRFSRIDGKIVLVGIKSAYTEQLKEALKSKETTIASTPDMVQGEFV